MIRVVIARSPAQVWNPTPIGSSGFGLTCLAGDGWRSVDDGGNASRRDGTLARSWWRSPGRAPGPMKPRPPALEIATARAGLEIKRMGAPTMSGMALHGYAFCSLCAARRPGIEAIGIE